MRQRIIFHCNHPIILSHCWNFLIRLSTIRPKSLYRRLGLRSVPCHVTKSNAFAASAMLSSNWSIWVLLDDSSSVWLIHLFNYRSCYALVSLLQLGVTQFHFTYLRVPCFDKQKVIHDIGIRFVTPVIQYEVVSCCSRLVLWTAISIINRFVSVWKWSTQDDSIRMGTPNNVSFWFHHVIGNVKLPVWMANFFAFFIIIREFVCISFICVWLNWIPYLLRVSQFCLLFSLAILQIHKEQYFEFVYTNCSAIQRIAQKKLNEFVAAHISFDAQFATQTRAKRNKRKNEISSGD